MAKAAMTPTAAPMAAIHRNTRPGEAASVRTCKAAAKMAAAKTTGMPAAKATAMTAATTAVARCEGASRHRGRADCYSRNERNNFIPHYTLLLPTDPPGATTLARHVGLLARRRTKTK